MSPYLAGGMLLAFLAWSGGMYYEGSHNESVACKAADSAATVVAYQHKDEITAKDTAINNTEVTTYEKNLDTIGALYSNGVSVTNPLSMSAIPSSLAGARPAACPRFSAAYHLTFKQCDEIKDGFNSLYDRDKQMAVIKR